MVDYQSWLPSWYTPTPAYQEATPTAQGQFVNTVNALMPYISPYDYRRWLGYNWNLKPEQYPAYTPEAVSAWNPTYTREQERQFESPQRYEAMSQAMFGNAGLIDPDSPVRRWLNQIIEGGKSYTPETGRRTRAQQQQFETELGGMITSPGSYGVSEEESGMWKPWLENVLAPTQKWLEREKAGSLQPWVKAASVYGPRGATTRGTGNFAWW